MLRVLALIQLQGHSELGVAEGEVPSYLKVVSIKNLLFDDVTSVERETTFIHEAG